MDSVRNWFATLAALALCATAATAPAFVLLAHSSLVTVDAALDAGTLILRVRRTAGGGPVPVTELQATLAGRNLPVTPRQDGTWAASLPGPTQSRGGTLSITVAHEGLREVLSGKLASSAATGGGSAAGSAAGLFNSHKQLAWWILNIAVVLIGVIAISRRMS